MKKRVRHHNNGGPWEVRGRLDKACVLEWKRETGTIATTTHQKDRCKSLKTLVNFFTRIGTKFEVYAFRGNWIVIITTPRSVTRLLKNLPGNSPSADHPNAKNHQMRVWVCQHAALQFAVFRCWPAELFGGPRCSNQKLQNECLRGYVIGVSKGSQGDSRGFAGRQAKVAAGAVDPPAGAEAVMRFCTTGLNNNSPCLFPATGLGPGAESKNCPGSAAVCK